MGAQWLSGRMLGSRPTGIRFEPYRRHCVVSLSKNINPSLVLVQPRKTRPFITERLLMGRKNSNLTNKIILSKQLETVLRRRAAKAQYLVELVQSHSLARIFTARIHRIRK